MVRSFQLGLNLGSAVALLVGVFLVYNTVSIGVVQRRREIGTLRALGSHPAAHSRALHPRGDGARRARARCSGCPWASVIGRAAISWRLRHHLVHLRAGERARRACRPVRGLRRLGARHRRQHRSPRCGRPGSPPRCSRWRRCAATWPREPTPPACSSWPTFVGLLLAALVYPTTLIPPPVENFPIGGYLAIFLIMMAVTLLSPLLLRVAPRASTSGRARRCWASPGGWRPTTSRARRCAPRCRCRRSRSAWR